MSQDQQHVHTPGMLTRRDRGAMAGALVGPIFVTAIVGAMRLANRPIPRPGSPAADVRDYYTGSAAAVRFSSSAQLVSVAALARYTASAVRLAGTGSTRPRFSQSIALASGSAAVATAVASAVTHASMTVEKPRTDEEVVDGARRMFVLGGPVHGVAFGILTGVVSLAGHRTGTLGSTAANTGLAAAAAGIVSPLYFRWEKAGWLIPIGRFGGYALCGIAGTRLARRPR